MNFLLKIVEGPMKGAEIALVPGTRLKVGRGDDCDIVLADASLAELAFELDVAEDGVTLVRSTGEMVAMRPFEVQEIGTTSVALGPMEGDWQPLVRPKPEESAKTEAPASEGSTEPLAEAAESVETPSSEPGPEDAFPGKRRRCFLAGLLGMVLLALLAAAVWWFGGRDGKWGRKVCGLWRSASAQSTRNAGSGSGADRAETSPEEIRAAQARATTNLLELASKHGLQLVETNGVRKLKGNVKLRTQRLALRALALAADRMVKFDLTDDETLCKSANETLLACSDGAVKAASAANRMVKLEGYAPSPAALEKVVRALNEDVKGIENLDTSAVAVGGSAPAQVADTPFVAQTEPSAEPPTRTRKGRRSAGGAPQDYPIAGILMVPFPCVIMRDGSKLIEGAQIGAATLVKIEADRLTLMDGGRRIEWRP